MPHNREVFEIRYFHRGRSFRPSKPLHFLPPIKLTTAAEQHSFTPHETAWQKTVTRGRGRERRHSRYRKMVMTVASYLTLGNVADMKFLCRDHVRPPQIVDEVTNARHLLALLENQRLLAENSLYFLQTLLYYIARPDLYQVVLDFRADRQDEYRGRGVHIKDEYQVDLEEDSQRLELANELLKFRKDLKPRRRLNQVDVSEMRRKLNDLSTKMQENIITMQHPNAPQGALEDSSGVDTTHDGHLQMMEKGNNYEEETTKDNNSTPEKLVAPKLSLAEPIQDCQSINQVVASGVPPSTQTDSTELQTQDEDTLPKIVQKDDTSGAVTSTNQEALKTLDNEREQNKGITPTKESTGDYHITEYEVEIQAENFGYSTPCPPPRETVLGINGIKVYDEVATTSENSIKHLGVKNAYKPPTSTDRTASKLHQLSRLSRDQRGSSRRGVQQKRKGKPSNKAKNSGTVDNEKTKETSRLKEDFKLPDIYDKYARQTAVQYNS